MKRSITLLIAILALVPFVRGWVPEETDVWPDGDVPVSFDFSNAPLGPYDWDAAARDAINLWNPLLQRVQLKVVPLAGPAGYDNGHNELYFDAKMYGQSFPSGVLAVTAISSDRGSRIETDIIFNKTQAWEIYNGKLTLATDFRRVAVHELGHVLGLGHPDLAGQTVSAIMNSTESDLEVPTADDAAGIHALYDRGSTAAPVLLGKPTSNTTTVIAGNGVKFRIAAGGRGPLAYVWRRDGTPVPGGTNASLVIAAAGSGDAGAYSVVVSNSGGSVTSDAVALKVTPATPPSFRNETNNGYAITAGDDLFLGAPTLAAGDSPLQWQWLHNGNAIEGATENSLVVSDVQFSDAGDYTVRATNAGASTTSIATRVIVAPAAPAEFTVDAAPVAVPLGGVLSLPANASGSGHLLFQWSKDGKPIPGATSATFTVSPFSAADAGSYTVTATNAFGSATSGASVVSVGATEHVPPLVTAHPAAVTDYAGSDVGFAVQAEGDSPHFQWFKDGVPIAGGSSPAAGQSVLIVPRIKASDAGTYHVEVSNTLGTVSSRGAKLTVLSAQTPIFRDQPASYTGVPGDSVTLSVNMQSVSALYSSFGVNGSFTFQWFKDGIALPITTDTYTFTPKESDSGKYFVRATSPAGISADSKTATVSIKPGAEPLITSQPGDFLMDASYDEGLRLFGVALEVQARRAATTPGTPVWSLLSASGPTQMGFTPGTYVVTATKDGVTETSPTFTGGFLPVTIPVLVRQPTGLTVEIGDSVGLNVSAGANAHTTCQWSKDGVDIPGATNDGLRIDVRTNADVGTFRVAVTSSLGTSVSEPVVVDIRRPAAPAITTQPQPAAAKPGDYVHMYGGAVGGNVHYQWLKNGAPITGATYYTLILGPVTASDTAAYSYVASNGSGLSSTSQAATLHVITDRPPAITLQPTDQSAVNGGDATFAVGATGGPLPDRYQWRRNGVDIPGATDAELRLHQVQSGDVADYSVVAYNPNGSATSMSARLHVDTSGRLINVATRAHVGNGDDVLIAGFVISGTKPRTLLIRGVGDQLSQFNVHGVLRNPILNVYRSDSTIVDSSDNWADGDDFDPARLARVAKLRAAEKESGAFALSEGSSDAALIATLAPGSYSAKVSGYVNTTGVALVEIYELGAPANDRLINLSCRSYVGTGEEVVIPGLAIRGSSPRRVLIRAVGPGLTAFHISGLLADPQLTVYHGSDPITSNNDWSDKGDPARIRDAGSKVGAFPLDPGSKDAAVLLDLDPGSYTIKVSGVNDTTGVALVEVYEVPME